MKVISVFGPFNSRALVEMSLDQADRLVEGDIVGSAPTDALDAVRRDLERLPDELAESTLAASALHLAFELCNPFNSATSKAACAKELRESMDRLRELAPEKPKHDALDDIARAREARLARAAASAAAARP